MKKYIIKNCPNLTTSYYSTGEIIHNQCGCSDDDMCKDINNCLLKQIVEKCKNYKESCEIEGNCLDKRLCSTCFLGGANELGEWILDDLEIEECEDE